MRRLETGFLLISGPDWVIDAEIHCHTRTVTRNRGRLLANGLGIRMSNHCHADQMHGKKGGVDSCVLALTCVHFRNKAKSNRSRIGPAKRPQASIRNCDSASINWLYIIVQNRGPT